MDKTKKYLFQLITPTTMYKQLFYEIFRELLNYKHNIYTNASKTEKGTEIAIITPYNYQQLSLQLFNIINTKSK